MLFQCVIENCDAQESSLPIWNKTILLHFGYPPGSNNWEYSHPLYAGTGGVQNLVETGSFNSKLFFNGQFELSKRYFGFSGGAGIFPAEIKVDKNETPFNFHSFFLEIEGLFFPLKDPTGRIVPLVKFGAGGAISYGDIDNNALFVSFAGGLRTYFSSGFGLSFIIKGRRFNYDEIPLDENITGDIKFTNMVIQLGAMYSF